MNRLVLHGGESIPYSEVPRLCQKCHGPTYRDWERGIPRSDQRLLEPEAR